MFGGGEQAQRAVHRVALGRHTARPQRGAELWRKPLGHAAAQAQGQAAAGVHGRHHVLQLLHGGGQQLLGLEVGARVLEHQGRQTGKAPLRRLGLPRQQVFRAAADVLEKRSRQRAGGIAAVERTHGVAKCGLAQPGAAAFIAIQPAPAAHLNALSVGLQGQRDGAGAGNQQCTRRARVGAQHAGYRIAFQRQLGAARVGLQKRGHQAGIVGAGQAEAERAVAPFRPRHAGLQGGGLQGLGHRPPGLFDALAQRRRTGLPFAQDAATRIAQPQAGVRAAAIDADPVTNRLARVARGRGEGGQGKGAHAGYHSNTNDNTGQLVLKWNLDMGAKWANFRRRSDSGSIRARISSRPRPFAFAALLPDISPSSDAQNLLRERLSRVAQRHPDSALRRLRALETRQRAMPDLAGALDTLYLRFYLLEHRGRALELQAELTVAAGAAAAAKLDRQAARVAEALGRIAYQQGNYLQATEQWSRALDLSEAAQDARVGVAARIGLGQIHYAMGAWSSGLRFHRDAAQQLKPLNDSYLSAKVALNLGVGHLESGQLEDAERQFSHGLAAARRGQHREFEAEAHWYLARAALARGELAWATADCRLALGIAGQLQHHWLEAAASRTWTEIALARGDEAAAIRSTRHGLELAERIQSKPQQRQAHLQLAKLLEKQGDLAGALAHLWRHVALQAELERQVPAAGLLAAAEPAPSSPSSR